MKRIICVILSFILLCIPISVCALETSAKAAVLINGDTGEIIYEQNANERLPMASTTKIMTALLLCEYANFDKEITVTAEMLRVEGSSMGLLAGDRVTLHDLLYGMLLASGNDAANVTAYVIGGTIDGFVKMMNNKAEQLGLENTHFNTPSGLDGESHYTTAIDLANLTRYAMQNEAFAKAAGSKSATLCYGNPPYRRTISNHNKLLASYEDAVGVKTGFTKKAGRCLVSAAKRDGKFVIAVTLNDPNDWADHKSMLEYGLSKVVLTEITPDNEVYRIPVVGADTDFLEIKAEPLIFSALTTQDIRCEINLPKFVYAPVSVGEYIGNIVYKKGDTVIAEKELYSDTKIKVTPKKRKTGDILSQNFKYIFLNLWEK